MMGGGGGGAVRVSIHSLLVRLNFCDTKNLLRNGRDMHEVVYHAEREQINALLRGSVFITHLT